MGNGFNPFTIKNVHKVSSDLSVLPKVRKMTESSEERLLSLAENYYLDLRGSFDESIDKVFLIHHGCCSRFENLYFIKGKLFLIRCNSANAIILKCIFIKHKTSSLN